MSGTNDSNNANKKDSKRPEINLVKPKLVKFVKNPLTKEYIR